MKNYSYTGKRTCDIEIVVFFLLFLNEFLFIHSKYKVLMLSSKGDTAARGIKKKESQADQVRYFSEVLTRACAHQMPCYFTRAHRISCSGCGSVIAWFLY